MKTRISHIVRALTATATLALLATGMTAAAQAQPIDTRIGNLSFERGFPSKETTKKVFDELDYQRAVQAYLWAYPAVSFESIRLGAKRDLGADLNDFLIADNYADPKVVWLTANDTTIYSLANVDLGKSGPKAGLFDGTWKLGDIEVVK